MKFYVDKTNLKWNNSEILPERNVNSNGNTHRDQWNRLWTKLEQQQQNRINNFFFNLSYWFLFLFYGENLVRFYTTVKKKKYKGIT